MPDPLPLSKRLREHAERWGDHSAALLREAATALEANAVLLLAAEALASRRTCQCPMHLVGTVEHAYACPIAIALEIRALRLSGSLPGPR